MLVIWPLTLMKRTHFSELSISRYSTYLRKTQGWTLHFERPIWEAKNSSAKWPGGHKSNAESKHIYCSFISIHYKLNLPRATDAKPQFASKISSLEVSNSPRPHQPWHTTVENQLGNLASFFKLSLAGDPTVTWHEEIVPWCQVQTSASKKVIITVSDLFSFMCHMLVRKQIIQ